MKQFMCHPHLTFTFGPQVNFIIGKPLTRSVNHTILTDIHLKGTTEVSYMRLLAPIPDFYPY